MKILAVSFSPRKDGNTVFILERVLSGARNAGAEVELYSVADKTIQPCDGCWACTRSGSCHIKDDMASLGEKMLNADGIVFGTPVYFYGMTAQAKAVMDRSIAFGSPERSLANKVGAVVATAGSLGLADTVKDFIFYMVTRRMLIAGYVAAYPGSPEELARMEKCLKAAEDLGRTMVALVKSGFRYPLELMGRPIAYGTHTK